MPPLNLHELTREDLRQQLVRWGFSSAHTKLLWNRLYLGLAESFAEMSDLPPRLRTHLESEATIGLPATVRETASSDGFTRKFLLGLADGHVAVDAHRRAVEEPAHRCGGGGPQHLLRGLD